MMEYKLTMKYQAIKKCPDKRRRNFYLFFLNGVLILRQKGSYYKNRFDAGFDGKNSIEGAYLLNGSIYQRRRGICSYNHNTHNWGEGKIREVRFSVSQKILKVLEVPKEMKIELVSKN